MRGSKSSQKWEFAPKYLLKSTANGTKVPKTIPMKETLLPCTQGLANTGAPFGLDLPHGPQKHKKNSKFDTFLTSLVFGFKSVKFGGFQILIWRFFKKVSNLY